MSGFWDTLGDVALTAGTGGLNKVASNTLKGDYGKAALAGATYGALGPIPSGAVQGAQAFQEDTQPGYGTTQGTPAPPIAGIPMPGAGDPTAQPATDFSNWQGDFSQPGQAESFFDKNQGAFTAPSASQGYWEGVAGKYNGGTPQSSNRAEEAYQQYQRQTPQNIDPYYDRQVENATNDIDRQLAASGMLGSSVGVNQATNAIGGIRAQQARDNADFQLKRGELSGNLASGADASSLNRSNNERGWLGTLGGLASGADNARIAGLQAGTGAATQAQNAMATRGQNFFNNQLNMGDTEAGRIQGIGGAMSQTDVDLLNQYISSLLGGAQQQYNDENNKRAENTSNFKTAASVVVPWLSK